MEAQLSSSIQQFNLNNQKKAPTTVKKKEPFKKLLKTKGLMWYTKDTELENQGKIV